MKKLESLVNIKKTINNFDYNLETIHENLKFREKNCFNKELYDITLLYYQKIIKVKKIKNLNEKTKKLTKKN